MFSDDPVKLVVPKCNGAVPAYGLAGASLISHGRSTFNPLGLKKSLSTEIFILPVYIAVLAYFLVDYYSTKQGYIEHIGKMYIAK